MPSGHLADIIRQPKILEEFTYTVGGRQHHPGDEPGYIYPLDLQETLLLHCSTLRMLNLDVDADLQAEKDDETLTNENSNFESSTSLPNQFIKSLKYFTALTHLSIGVDLLLGKPSDISGHPLPSFQPHEKPGECQYHTDQISSSGRNDKGKNDIEKVTGVEEPIPSGRHKTYDSGLWLEEYDWASESEEFDSSDEMGASEKEETEEETEYGPPPPCLFNFYLDDGYSSGSRYSMYPRLKPSRRGILDG
ncbi:uncharacterized protein GIQ15_05397 [Arthroderma uncinatum]|uniref:uncharacterized protein n=1 Tax=Arthroderma uncinatum TaxID=74035 RepID=UPI00144AA5CA|nr:uncharacterized protein GIQ15_05397 [Arthroderma uncinatum]KAF3480050.1 hypothetical protein GIQ15_05397 [Arthroderma uncinatum]